ncbi:MAG: hypothetical protein CMJ31_11195 [Phycisphaerae bacterium]|nr:hypothetical protein [Phycisphaerae bacterium]
MAAASSEDGASGTASPRAGATKARRGRIFASYEAANRFLDDRVNVERLRAHRVKQETFKLDRMRAMLSAIGDPQATLRCVHVAGSKGKGSVCEMVASCLRSCGYTVGLYTSPHLVDVRERIRVETEASDDDDRITEDAFVRVISRARDAVNAVKAKHGEATYFEILTLAALLHFAEQAVDVAVIEVGLGGRLDSTNIVTPDVCAITHIQMEHRAILGETLEKIAFEKAGIMKPAVPVISVPQEEGVIEVFRQRAAEVGSELFVLGQEIDYSTRFEAAHQMKPHVRVCVTTDKSNFEHLPSPLPGEHQAANCGLALAIIDRLRRVGFECPDVPVAEGLSRTPRRGRMEQVWDEPRVIIDGCHTKESVSGLVAALGASERFDSLVVIFGCSADKDVGPMLDEIGRGADKIIFTKASDNPRAMEPGELLSMFNERSEKMAQCEPNVKEAINAAARAVGRPRVGGADLIVVAGSFHLAGEAKALFEAKKRVTAGV